MKTRTARNAPAVMKNAAPDSITGDVDLDAELLAAEARLQDAELLEELEAENEIVRRARLR